MLTARQLQKKRSNNDTKIRQKDMKMSNDKWIFFLNERDRSVPSIGANVATGNTIRFRGCSFYVPMRVAATVRLRNSRNLAATAIAD